MSDDPGQGPFDRRHMLALSGRLEVRPVPPALRLIVRGGEAARAAASAAFGAELSAVACRAHTRGERAALWLGPDEWLLLAPVAEAAAHLRALDDALRDTPHALVDVSHRQGALEIAGPLAADLLNAGCPLDLDARAFGVDHCARTLLGKCEIVLWRTAAEAFHLEAQRSCAAYVWDFLVEAAREFGGDAA